MNATTTSPKLTPENLAACLRQGCYVCGHCSRINHIGHYFEPEQTPACSFCKKRALRWYPPVLDGSRN